MPLIQSIKDGHYLTFDEGRHEYFMDGERLPGVTTLVKSGMPESIPLTQWKIGHGVQWALDNKDKYSKAELIKLSKKAYEIESKKAASIGIFTHDYAYYTELGEISKANEILEKAKLEKDWNKIEQCINKFKEWHNETSDKIIASEKIVASIKHRYCGKFDRLVNRNGLVILSDFKTSSGIYVDQFIQLAAYTIAIKEWLDIDVDAIEIIRFGKTDGSFEVKTVKSKSSIEEFKQQAIRCIETYRFKSKWENSELFKYVSSRTKKTK